MKHSHPCRHRRQCLRYMPYGLLACLAPLLAHCVNRQYNAGAQTAATSSTPATPDRFAFDVLDVSILFPVAQTADGKAALPPLSIALKKPLFDSALAAVENKNFFSGSNADRPQMKENYRAAHSLDLWRIVGMRLDPCFKQTISQTTCRRQLRFVAQPIVVPARDLKFPSGSNELDYSEGSKDAMALDDTIHLVYDIPEDRFLGLTTEFNVLKSVAGGTATSGKPLGVHPGFTGAAKVTGGGRFTELAHAIIRKYAAGRDPLGIAIMAGFDGLTAHDHGGAWTFAIGVVQAGTFVPLPKLALVTTPQLTAQNNLFDGFGPDAEFVPLPKVDATNGAQTSLAALRAAGAPAAKTYESALRVNNPLHLAQGDTDCASCHIAQDLKTHAGTLDAGQKAALEAKFGYKGAPGLTQRRDAAISTPSRDVYAFRMFGQFELTAFASPRTLNESSEAARVLNTLKPLAPTTEVEFVTKQDTALKATIDAAGTDTTKRCLLTAGQRLRGRVRDLNAPSQHWKVALTAPVAGCGVAGEAFLFGPHNEISVALEFKAGTTVSQPPALVVPSKATVPVAPVTPPRPITPVTITQPVNPGVRTCITHVVKKGGARAFAAADFASQVLGTLAAGAKVAKKAAVGEFVQGTTPNISGKTVYVAADSLECP